MKNHGPDEILLSSAHFLKPNLINYNLQPRKMFSGKLS